jgi:3-oxoacyl-[acyl-carrier-protein] synthase III
MTATITGVGAALPKTCVKNDAFVSLGVTDDWIISRTGVRERYHLQQGERLVELAMQAAQGAMKDCGIEGDALDMVIVATSTPDRISPGLAAELAHMIGANRAGAIDLNGACTGFLYALDYAISRIEHGTSDCILVVGADAMSRLADLKDPNTAFLFGDGAGAVIVKASGRQACDGCVQYLSFGSAGAGTDYLFVSRETGLLEMDGGEVYAAAVDAMSEEIENVLRVCEFEKEDVDHVVCHQANERIVRAVARQLNLPGDKVVSYVSQFGNTSSASIPIALWKAQQEQRLKPGNRVVLAAFGAGFTWGAGVVNWKGCQHK